MAGVAYSITLEAPVCQVKFISAINLTEGTLQSVQLTTLYQLWLNLNNSEKSKKRTNKEKHFTVPGKIDGRNIGKCNREWTLFQDRKTCNRRHLHSTEHTDQQIQYRDIKIIIYNNKLYMYYIKHITIEFQYTTIPTNSKRHMKTSCIYKI